MRRLIPLLTALLFGSGVSAADLDVAFIGTLSGVAAVNGRDALDGFRLAVRHLGGRLGGVEFALSVTDDMKNPDLARQAAEAAWQSPHPHILLVATASGALELLAPQAVSHRSIIFNLGPIAAPLAGHDCQANLFSLVPRPELLQEVVGQYLQAQGFHRLAVFDSAATAPMLEAFRRGFKGEVVEIKSGKGVMDFAPNLARIADAKADAGYLLHNNGMAVEFLLQYAAGRHKGKMPLFAPPETLDQPILAASAPAALDLFSIGNWSDDLDSPANKRLSSDYEAEYGRPLSARAAAGYDAAMLLDAAIRAIDRKVNDVDGLRNAVKRVEFPSARGGFRFDNDQFPLLTYLVRQVATDSRGRLINEQRGVAAKDVRDSLARDCPLPPALPPFPPKVK